MIWPKVKNTIMMMNPEIGLVFGVKEQICIRRASPASRVPVPSSPPSVAPGVESATPQRKAEAGSEAKGRPWPAV